MNKNTFAQSSLLPGNLVPLGALPLNSRFVFPYDTKIERIVKERGRIDVYCPMVGEDTSVHDSHSSPVYHHSALVIYKGKS